MTLDEIKVQLEAIRISAGDDEAAHGLEDTMRENVLRAIANGETDDPAAAAAEALKSSDIQFFRWCA